jgi:uncharacterized protein (TIGR02145 family)
MKKNKLTPILLLATVLLWAGIAQAQESANVYGDYTTASGATGATELLSSGTASENTPYWNGTSWVISNSNIINNGTEVEITSTTQGFLPPHMTTTQRDAIASSAAGLTMYNTTVNCLQSWNGTLWDDYDGCGNIPANQYAAGSVFCASGSATIVEVISSTGKIWMDRNLGASQVATSSTDASSYGDLYQWGRNSDGHQCRNSATTSTLSSSNQPGHGDFIIAPSAPNDWRNPQNTNLWQGVNGVNNPCPSLYRIPTSAELNTERESWSSNNAAGAFASPLKLPMAHNRDRINGSFENVGIYGVYWSSTINSPRSRNIYFGSSNSGMDSGHRAYGFSVRCIKD